MAKAAIGLTALAILAMVIAGALSGSGFLSGGGWIDNGSTVTVLSGRTVAVGSYQGTGLNALSISGSVVGTATLYMAEPSKSCGKLVLAYNQLTGASTSQEIPWLVVPARFVITELRFNPATLYTWTGVGTSITGSLQQQGNTATPDVLQAQNIMSGGLKVDDHPSNPNATVASFTLSLNIAANAAFSNLSGGSLEVSFCGEVMP